MNLRITVQGEGRSVDTREAAEIRRGVGEIQIDVIHGFQTTQIRVQSVERALNDERVGPHPQGGKVSRAPRGDGNLTVRQRDEIGHQDAPGVPQGEAPDAGTHVVRQRRQIHDASRLAAQERDVAGRYRLETAQVDRGPDAGPHGDLPRTDVGPRHVGDGREQELGTGIEGVERGARRHVGVGRHGGKFDDSAFTHVEARFVDEGVGGDELAASADVQRPAVGVDERTPDHAIAVQGEGLLQLQPRIAVEFPDGRRDDVHSDHDTGGRDEHVVGARRDRVARPVQRVSPASAVATAIPGHRARQRTNGEQEDQGTTHTSLGGETIHRTLLRCPLPPRRAQSASFGWFQPKRYLTAAKNARKISG